MAKYPTKEQILEIEPQFRKETKLIINMWKATALEGWKRNSSQIRIEKLKQLIEALSELYEKPAPELTPMENVNAYNSKTKTIYIDYHNPSIISTLHEFAHHLHGASELKACRWSVWLFKDCFEDQYKKLKWKGHLLVK